MAITEYEGSDVPRSQGTWGYYRQPDGFITVSPATNSDELRYRRSGWEPLSEYGTFEVTTPYMVAHPLEPLFMAGGEHELTLDQIRRQGLYMDPPVIPNCRTPLNQNHKRHTRACLRGAKPVVFPQLVGVEDLGPFPCEMGCPDRVFATLEARAQHTTVMHAPEKSDERTGESLAAALVKGLGGRLPVGAEPIPDGMVVRLVDEMRERMEAMAAELAALKGTPAPTATAGGRRYTATCEDCGQAFHSDSKQQYANAALRAHRRAKHVIPGLEAENARLDEIIRTEAVGV